MTRTATRARRGFTLVELMVAAAVCVLIMAILASCFQMGIDTMRHLKSTGDMAENLRAASTVIRRDLRAEHFPRDPNAQNGTGTRVSDLAFDAGAGRPVGGFFRVRSTAPVFEAADAFNIGSTRADAAVGRQHQLQFTAILKGSSDQEWFYTQFPSSGRNFKSRVAEVAYFLDTTPRGTTNTGLVLHHLIRRQRLVAESAEQANQLPSPGNPNGTADPPMKEADIGVIALNNAAPPSTPCLLADLVTPAVGVPPVANRLATGPGGDTMTAGNDADLAPLVNAARLGDDILLSNVISFEVRLAWTGSPGPRPFNPPAVTDTPFDTLDWLPATAVPVPGVFDTGSTPSPKIRVRAVQIIIRVWDPKLQNTRQTTIVQDL